jgi:hypothetical protein
MSYEARNTFYALLIIWATGVVHGLILGWWLF